MQAKATALSGTSRLVKTSHVHPRQQRKGANVVAKGQQKTDSMTGIVFKPFDEVQLQLKDTSQRGDLNDPTHSFVRMHFDDACEAAVNEQINVEYNISYVYHSMSAYFDRDNVSLPGFAQYFRRNSEEEREHAQKLMDFQNTRGGRVKLNAIVVPETEYNHPEKGDALFAMELALSLERLNFDKLLRLWETLEKGSDAQATTFVEEMLTEQVEDIKKAADYVAQLRRVGKGLGVWSFDQELYEEEIRHMAAASGK